MLAYNAQLHIIQYTFFHILYVVCTQCHDNVSPTDVTPMRPMNDAYHVRGVPDRYVSTMDRKHGVDNHNDSQKHGLPRMPCESPGVTHAMLTLPDTSSMHHVCTCTCTVCYICLRSLQSRPHLSRHNNPPPPPPQQGMDRKGTHRPRTHRSEKN